jgi:toluene monooxygenase system protein E
MKYAREPFSGLKTYSHLTANKRVPTTYEIVSTNLLYYKGNFEVSVPVQGWYDKYQKQSLITGVDWTKFRDPRETTYTTYVTLQKSQEEFVAKIFQSMNDSGNGYDKHLELFLAPLRFPIHGFQMIAAYFGQMAPEGRIVLTSMFQAADEMRRIQHFAYRMRQLQNTTPHFGKDSKNIWETNPHWQPLRKVVEKLLVTYDWAEALVALNFILKPAFEKFILSAFKDKLTVELVKSQNQDWQWQRDWTNTLINLMIEQNPKNREIIEIWMSKWQPECEAATKKLEGLLT